MTLKTDWILDEIVSPNHMNDICKNINENTKKLNGIDNNANNYTHPDKHPASIIQESETKRFVSNQEINQIVSNIGDLSKLNTESKLSLVASINEVVTNLGSIKLEADNVSIKDLDDLFTSDKVEGALKETMTKVTNGQNHKITNDDGTAINSVGADLNNLTNTGTYVGNNWINAPSINYALVEVKKGTSGITKQLFTETTSTKQYMRIFRSGVWTTWRSL